MYIHMYIYFLNFNFTLKYLECSRNEDRDLSAINFWSARIFKISKIKKSALVF